METATLELPGDIYEQLLSKARESGKTPAEWIADRIESAHGARKPRGEPTQQEIDEANRRLRECIVDLGYATGTDNESIDADLAREYGDNHEDLYDKIKP